MLGGLGVLEEERRVVVRSREELEKVVHTIELLYVEGVRSLRIELEEPLTGVDLEKINSVLRRLPGFEISLCTPRNIVLQDVMESSPDEVFKIIYEATKKLFDDILEAVEKEDAEIAEAIENAHDIVHRYAQRFRRHISQSPRKARELFEKAGHVTFLEKVADYLAHTAHAVARRGIFGGMKQEVIRVMRMTKDLLEASFEAYKKGERGKADAIIRAEEFLQKEISRLMEKAVGLPDRFYRLPVEAVLIHMNEIIKGIHQVALDLLKSEK